MSKSGRHESHSFWAALMVVSCLAAIFMPTAGSGSRFMIRYLHSEGEFIAGGIDKQYAVIFDAGSTGSRVHVFSFDHNFDLLPVVGDKLELFVKTEPGLSAYADDPKAAANSLLPLLEKAVSVIPEELQSTTPVKVGATAGLRQLKGDAPEKILEAVRTLLKNESKLLYRDDWVTILDGTYEGSYQWVTINYLLGNLGEQLSRTVGTVDQGGGSVQMTYAISKDTAANAPTTPDGKGSYVKEMHFKGEKYYLYAHSYLHYGLLAARVEIIKAAGNPVNPCILDGYTGTYKYNGAVYDVSSSPDGPNIKKCRQIIKEALNVDAACSYGNCTFDGIWNGGGGDGMKDLYVASFFYGKLTQVGFVDPKTPTAKVRPVDYLRIARKACATKNEDINSLYPKLLDAPFVCMDLVYEFTLLVDGLGLNPFKRITVVEKVNYKGQQLVEAAWPLGSAIDAISSKPLLQTMQSAM